MLSESPEPDGGSGFRMAKITATAATVPTANPTDLIVQPERGVAVLGVFACALVCLFVLKSIRRECRGCVNGDQSPQPP